MSAPRTSIVLRTAALLASLLACLPAGAQSADLPPLGRSLFDHLTTDAAGIQRVPFPFTALVARVQRAVGPDRLGHAGVRSVLIPLGRSLQRNASVSEAYRYPRVVAAVVGEPVSGAPLLRDRLYLGYHEKAALLEVISYNEAAGRFEFQVVKDYQQGGAARVFHSRRVVCLSCHHGGGPIFSRPGWDETNANRRVAAQLGRGGGTFHGVPAARSIDEPNAIDNAVARAGRLAITQRLWREGCARADAIECRAQALLAALKYRLGADAAVDAGTASYRGQLVEPLRRTAQALWPDGLPLADPNIPNRDPLASFPVDQGDFGDGAALLRSAEVRPAFDPLQPRPALGRWHAGNESDVDDYVRGIADFIAPADVGLIDLRLQQLRTAASRRVVRAPCRVEESTRGATIECAAAPSLRVDIRLTAAGEKAATGTVSRVALAGASMTRSLKLDPAHRHATRALRSAWTYRGGSARLSDSTAIEGIALRWANTGQFSAEVELQLADDVPTLARAVDALARQARLGRDDALGEAAVRRAALLRGLFAQLGIAAPPGCCDQPVHGAPPALDEDATPSTATLPAQLQPFVRQCAACHDTREAAPPGFLHGNAEAVQRNLTRCAERIAYRLAMWEQPPQARQRVPMPPPLLNGAAAAPPPPAELALMREYLAQFARPAAQRDVPYEALAPCRSDMQ